MRHICVVLFMKIVENIIKNNNKYSNKTLIIQNIFFTFCSASFSWVKEVRDGFRTSIRRNEYIPSQLLVSASDSNSP